MRQQSHAETRSWWALCQTHEELGKQAEARKVAMSASHEGRQKDPLQGIRPDHGKKATRCRSAMRLES